MQRRLLLATVLLATLALAEEDEDLVRAREKIHALEGDIQQVIDKAAPAVGAVVNHTATLDVKTGKVVVRPRSLGSGVVISRDGFLLTNVHVVEGAGYLSVALPGGLHCSAVLYADTASGKVKGDIALLKLRHPDGGRFEYADWRAGQPRRLKPGSFVFAMGNPHGHALDGTPVVTMGIISGKGRAAAETGYLYVDSLQTDAEINPGNSGGPLFDSRGHLVGINGLMSSRAGRSNSGVGFAIPIDQIRLFLKKLFKDEGGGIGYGYHGLEVVSAKGEKGALVRRVDRNSPAEKAGLRKGDIVHRVNRKKVNNRSDFVNLVGKLPEGKFVSISYRRDRRGKSARFKLVSYSEYLASIGRSRTRSGPLPTNERGFLGFEYVAGRTGLRITKVMPNTGAEKLGLRKNDVVEELDGSPVGAPTELWKRLATRASEEVVSIVYLRGPARKKGKLVLCDPAAAAGKAGE
jgi:serine protease Do